MKSYEFALSATIPKLPLHSEGNAFYYVTGTSAGNFTLTIKPERGEEFDLKPGQSVRLPEKIGTWYISSKDGSSVITGQIIIGDGVFADSNIFSTTTIAPGQTVGINNVPHVITRPEILTGSFADAGAQGANTNLQIVAAAANVNGVIIHNAQLIWTGGGRQSFLAKATAPASIFDGTLILTQDIVGSGGTYGARDIFLQSPIVIPAGLAIWYRTVADPNGYIRTLQYTVL